MSGTTRVRLRRLGRTARAVLRRHPLSQVIALVLLWLSADAAASFLGAAIPGNVIGLAALLALLATRTVHPGDVRAGAYWLLGRMLLFFVPATVALLDYPEFLGLLGLKLLLAIVGGTLAVMLVTGLTVALLIGRKKRHAS